MSASGQIYSEATATPFCLVFITDRRPHSTIHRRGPSLSGCHCSYLEQFTPARHFCTFVACLPVTPQDSSLRRFLSQSVTMYRARAVTLVISDTLIVHATYLLTYLLIAYESNQLVLAFEIKIPLSESSCGLPHELSMPPRIDIPNFSAGNLINIIS